jgi:23S rRNA (pseudouridine1915-N3)-methyltransferase
VRPLRLTLICVGRLSSEYQAVWRHYESLLRPYADVEIFEVPEAPLAAGEDFARSREGGAITGLLRKGAVTVALDGGGQQYSSEEWSALLADKKLHGQSHFQFLIGGASGLDTRALGAADILWSLSRLTFPHQMARCIVLEQLYRAIRIERGEPYHH